jgi:hypothetical protein
MSRNRYNDDYSCGRSRRVSALVQYDSGKPNSTGAIRAAINPSYIGGCPLEVIAAAVRLPYSPNDLIRERSAPNARDIGARLQAIQERSRASTRAQKHERCPEYPVLAQPSVYQDLLFQRLRTLHGDHLDDRTSWVITASGPLQRPTYASLLYRTWSAALPVVDVMLILKSRWRRDGERVWPDTGRCKGVCCCESAREITSLSRQGIAKETPGRLEYSERRLTHRKARRRRRRSKHGSARLFVDVTLATDRGGPVGGRQIGLESTMAAKYEGQRRVGVTGGSIERSQGFKKQPQP